MQNIEQIKLKIIKFLKNKKEKTVTLSDIYMELGLAYGPASDKLIYDVLNVLVVEKYIAPLKTSKTNKIGSYQKYRIFQQNEDDEKRIQTEIVNTLVKPVDIQFLLKHPSEYIKNKDFIQSLNSFLKNPDRCIITVNERSYQIFKNEKMLKENENFLSKLKLKFEDLFCYDTYEPFFYYQNPDFKGNEKIILIVENKDTFWTMKKAIENLNINVFLLIYGEGKKILNSFSFIENFDITNRYEIQYFGDIDYEGVNIYVSLKNLYINYNIKIFEEGYKAILDLARNPQNIRTKQNKNEEYIKIFLEEFDEEYKEILSDIFQKNKYIPQEVFNYKVISERCRNDKKEV